MNYVYKKANKCADWLTNLDSWAFKKLYLDDLK